MRSNEKFSTERTFIANSCRISIDFTQNSPNKLTTTRWVGVDGGCGAWMFRGFKFKFLKVFVENTLYRTYWSLERVWFFLHCALTQIFAIERV